MLFVYKGLTLSLPGYKAGSQIQTAAAQKNKTSNCQEQVLLCMDEFHTKINCKHLY